MIQLLRTYLRTYRYRLLAVLILQGVQATASLLLPSLNADIIDKGVLPGDTAYIWRIGAMMLMVSAVQVIFSVGAVYCASKAAMGFGRDVRAALCQRGGASSAADSHHCGHQVSTSHGRSGGGANDALRRSRGDGGVTLSERSKCRVGLDFS